MLIRMEKLIKTVFVGIVKNGYGYFGHGFLKLPVPKDFRRCVVKNLLYLSNEVFAMSGVH